MSAKPARMITPTRRVRGLGSAHDGTMHFWLVRLTSVALVPLTLFALGLIVSLLGADYETVRATLARPLVAIALALFVVITLEHMRLGMQEVVADYIHSELTKVALLMLNTFFTAILGAAALFALLKIAFGA